MRAGAFFVKPLIYKVMAKSSNFFGLRTGSTKSLTFSVYRGQQITKDRVTRISNPRTTAQMQQRALVPIVAAARSMLKGIVNHSFEGIAYGETSLREFSSQNLKKDFLKVVSYPPKGYSDMGFAELLVSKGTIADNAEIVPNEDGELQFKFELPNDAKELKFPAIKAGESAEPIFSTLEKYARENNISTIAPGTQVTPIAVSKADSIDIKTPLGTKNVNLARVDVTRFLIPNSSTTERQLEDVNEQWKIDRDIAAEGSSTVYLVNGKNENIRISYSAGQLLVAYAPSASEVVGGAAILSRFTGNVWRRNTAKLSFYESLISEFSFEDWVSAYGSSASSASEEYLNNGTNSPSGEKPVKPVTPVP